VAEHPVTVAGAVSADLPAPIATYFAALNAEDFARLETVWADDAELRAVGARDRHGRDDVMGYYRPLFGPWAEHEDRPTRAVVADGVAVVEVAFSGVTHDGRAIAFDAVDVFDLADDRVARLTCWYDLAWVRKQLA
jgi:ketosteroid isomerase-like protein